MVSTKGGVGKTTVAANLGGFLADAGLRVLMIDLDSQPTLSSYYPLVFSGIAGTFELVGQRLTALDQIVSRTCVERLHVVLSNDPLGQLNTLLLHAADGRLRLKNLLHIFAPFYDVVLIDTQGARSVIVEMSVLASDIMLSPIPPEMLAARELHRGTLALLDSLAPYEQLGVRPPPVRLLLNQVNLSRRDTRLIIQSLSADFVTNGQISLCSAVLLDRVAYLNAASVGLPVHRIDDRPSPAGTLGAAQSMRQLAIELFPEWHSLICPASFRPPKVGFHPFN